MFASFWKKVWLDGNLKEAGFSTFAVWWTMVKVDMGVEYYF
jgi:hypothetical protein